MQEKIIQDLLLDYKKNRDLTPLLDEISRDIYNFPIKVFNLDIDTAGDFYLYAIDKIKKRNILNKFQGRSKFSTWFYQVLRNLILDFLRTKKKEPVFKNIIYTNNKGDVFDILDNIPDNHQFDDSENHSIVNKVQLALKRLKIEYRIILKLHLLSYFDFDTDELKFISEKSGMPLREIISRIAFIKANISNENPIYEKISKLFYDVCNIQKEIFVLYNENKKNEALIKEKKLKKKRLQLERLRKRLNTGSNIEKTTMTDISQLLNISNSNAGVLLHRAVKSFKKIYRELL